MENATATDSWQMKPGCFNGVVQIPKQPRDVKTNFQGFLGMIRYYRQYIPNFSSISQPLNRLTRKGDEWVSGQDKQVAFNRLKEHLALAPVLGYPHLNFPYILDMDASGCEFGTVLFQVQEEPEHIIAFFSKMLKSAERNYCLTGGSCLPW